ncbi:hypothetical protein H5410_040877 [Solanum commersonii]|uniref:Uncharacterized protein n=1 Tax=Solanum commersonii TaxID=4109 RepID=A0A9J5XQ15_SOLCO|nr:hypothetical protein H5410_040877 [Solanum commersonii]
MTWTWFMQHSLELQNGERLKLISDMHKFEDQLQEIKKVDEEVGENSTNKYPPKTLCKAYLDTLCKNYVLDNNLTELFNDWILEARYKQIIWMLGDIIVKIMERFEEKSGCCEEYLKISKVSNVSGNVDNVYEVSEGPQAIKAMEHKKMIPMYEIDWYYSKGTTLAVYKHKLQPKAFEEDINCITPRPTQESQSEFQVASNSYIPVDYYDDEDPRLRPKKNSEEAYLTRLRNRQNPQEQIRSRVISFHGDKFGVSEPTNLSMTQTGLIWKGKDAFTTNQLRAQMIQNFMPRMGL